MARGRTGRPSVFATFAEGAWNYWLSVFAQAREEREHWQTRAQAIPDPTLRHHALEAHRAKAGNVEGATAFAAFVSPQWRRAVIRAQVCFQSAYDYLDTLTEQPSAFPERNGRQLHLALLAACDPSAPRVDYYAHNHACEDAGYLTELVDGCQLAVSSLPAWPIVAPSVGRLTQRIVEYQSLNLTEAQGGQHKLACWASREIPAGTGLAWWEAAASAGSSLGIFALIAAAARPELQPDDAGAIEQAYWPWIGALHSLLDSLVDLPQDSAAGQRSLLDYYETVDQTVTRMRSIAEHAIRAVDRLPQGNEHAAVVRAMVGFYLAGYQAHSAMERAAAEEVRRALGLANLPSIIVFRARRVMGSVGALLG